MINTGVLFTRAEAKKVPPNISPMDSRGYRFVRREAALATASTTPVRTSAPDKMNIAAMVTGTGLAKHFSMSSRGRYPNTHIIALQATATMTARNTTTSEHEIQAHPRQNQKPPQLKT